MNTTHPDQPIRNTLKHLALASAMGAALYFGAPPASAVPPVNDGLELHLDASAIVGLSNGATVNTWTDSSAMGGNVTTHSGIAAPGNSIESIATGNLALLASATFAQEIDKSAALGLSGDLAATTGSLSITSGAILTLTELGTSGAWTGVDTITLIGYSTGTWNGGLFTYLGTPPHSFRRPCASASNL